jgi:hypothetical protein
MRYALFAVMAISEACAPVAASAPTVSAQGISLDFVDVAPGRCSPEIDGFVMSAEAATDLVRGVRMIERDAKIAGIECKRDKDILDARNRALQDEAKSDKAWSMVGKIGVTGAAVLTTITTILLILKATGGL